MAITEHDLGSVIGPAGPQGPAGPAGAQGAEGKTPSIGANGHWFVGDRDTGIMGDASKAVAAKIVNSLATTQAGYALDARQGKVLDGKIASLNSTLSGLNADLEVNTRKIEGGYLDLYVTSIGKLTWVRISGYPKIALKSGQSYDMFKIAVNTPLYSVYRRINISPTLGIVFTLSSTDAQVTITPFGGDISTTTGVNVSEMYVMK